MRCSKAVAFGALLAVMCPAAFAAGAFSNAATLSTGLAPRTVVVADFNHDSYDDLAVANEGSNSLTVLLATGACTTLPVNCPFAAAANYAAGSAPTSIGAGHFRRNNRWDLVAANTSSNNLTVLLSRANGTFPVSSTIAIADGLFLQRLVVADFNNDNLDDIAVISANSNPRFVAVLLNDGNCTSGNPADCTPSFSQANYALSGFLPWGLTAARLRTGPGQPLDLVVSNYYANFASVLLGNGDGTFGSESKYPTPNYTPYVTVAEFNHDGRRDAVITNYGGQVSFLPGNGAGALGTRLQSPAGYSTMDIENGEFTGNTHRDAVVTNYLANRFTVLSGNGNGSFTPGVPVTTGVQPLGVAVADVDGNGLDDVVVVNQGSNTVQIFLQQ